MWLAFTGSFYHFLGLKGVNAVKEELFFSSIRRLYGHFPHAQTAAALLNKINASGIAEKNTQLETTARSLTKEIKELCEKRITIEDVLGPIAEISAKMKQLDDQMVTYLLRAEIQEVIGAKDLSPQQEETSSLVGKFSNPDRKDLSIMEEELADQLSELYEP